MMKRIFCAILAVLLLCGCAVSADPEQEKEMLTFTDDTGRELCVAKKPERVAVLFSSLADLWITAGGQVDITVGETVERGFAGENAILVDAGAGKTVDLEALIAAEPDFVLYSCDISGQLECASALADAGIPAAGFAVESFGDYLRVLKIATDLTGNSDAYDLHGTQLKEKVDALIASAQARDEQPTVLFVRAGSSAKYTKAKNAENHFVCGMLQELGTVNIADAAPILLDGLSIEQILINDPDYILFTTMGDESAGAAYMQSLVEDPVWQTLTAVKTGNVYQLPKDYFQYKPNSRWDEAYAWLIDLLYGEAV